MNRSNRIISFLLAVFFIANIFIIDYLVSKGNLNSPPDFSLVLSTLNRIFLFFVIGTLLIFTKLDSFIMRIGFKGLSNTEFDHLITYDSFETKANGYKIKKEKDKIIFIESNITLFKLLVFLVILLLTTLYISEPDLIFLWINTLNSNYNVFTTYFSPLIILFGFIGALVIFFCTLSIIKLSIGLNNEYRIELNFDSKNISYRKGPRYTIGSRFVKKLNMSVPLRNMKEIHFGNSTFNLYSADDLYQKKTCLAIPSTGWTGDEKLFKIYWFDIDYNIKLVTSKDELFLKRIKIFLNYFSEPFF